MSEERLVGLTLLSIESDILRELHFDDVIDALQAKRLAKYMCKIVNNILLESTLSLANSKFVQQLQLLFVCDKLGSL